MDPSSSNGFQLKNKPTSDPNPNLSDEHSSQELISIGGSHSLENETVEILRYIDQILMEDELEPHIMLQESSDFRAKERSFLRRTCKKYPPSPQQESPSLNVAQYVDDANNTDAVTIEEISHSELATANNYVSIQEFDDIVWMYTVDEKLAADIAKMEITRNNMMLPCGAKIRTKKRNNREKDDEVVDFRALLFDCAKSVSSNDRLTANNLLRQIRQHSSPYGDGEQRFAHYVANGLEARLAGTCSKIQQIPNSFDYLRVYCISDASSPIRKISSFASNETIADRSKKATRIHVIDFGILYGIQWPGFIQRVAGREGGPPEKLRITGVEFPQVSGIIEDTGHRLARYAERLGVPFEYKSVAREWETIKIEDLKIDKDEFVAVVCSVRAMQLLVNMVGIEESPRAMFLELIKEINPNIFIHGILNVGLNQPLFVNRFRELLNHFQAIFDMMEAFVPRDKPERMMVERDLLGKEIFNVIACEGPERVERPETYNQWQVRHMKAGFTRVPFEKKLMDAIVCKVSNLYHKDFVVFTKHQWMMMSWKGRVFYAISCWQPV